MSTLSKLRRLVLRQDVSVREASRRLGISRNTATKWLKDGQMAEPRYPQRVSGPSILDPYKEQLGQWLKADSHRSKRDRRGIKAMFEALRAQGYRGSRGPRSTLKLARGKPEAAPAPAPVQETPRPPVPKSVLQTEPVQQELLAGFGQSSPGPGSRESASGTSTEATPPKKSVTPEPEAIPQLALEDAYRILKVVAGDSWEKVEAARRKIVLKSSPLVLGDMTSAQVQKLVTEARLANDAAVVIAARRSGRQ